MISFLSGGSELKNPQAPKYIEHLYADFVELNALFSKEETTPADILDFLVDNEDEIFYNFEDDEIPESEDAEEIASPVPQKNDASFNRMHGVFNVCEDRSILYGKEYPFVIKDHYIKLKQEITEKQKIYLFLLICSSLYQFDNSCISLLTKEFELLCYYCMKNFLPKKAIVKSFGKNSDYSGNLKGKIEKLSRDINVGKREKEVSEISAHNVNERGLDLISWMPFFDKNPNMLIFLCQATCEKKWKNKQGETRLFANYFDFTGAKSILIHTFFLSYGLVNVEKDFYQSDIIYSENLLFDRKRIIEYISEKSASFNFRKFESYEIVNTILDTTLKAS